MRQPPITLYRMDTHVTPMPNGYRLTPHGWFAWLHRALWWALTKMRAVGHAYEDKVEVIRLPLSGDEIVGRIFEAYQGLHSIRQKPTEILIGPETLDELISCPAIRDYGSPFSFSGRAGFGQTLFNLPVTVLPQMEGVIVR